jgi:hypothetical protein
MEVEIVNNGEFFNRGMRYKLVFDSGYSQYFTDGGFAELGKEIAKLRNQSSNSDYAKCADAIMELFECENSLVRQALKQIIEKHFS